MNAAQKKQVIDNAAAWLKDHGFDVAATQAIKGVKLGRSTYDNWRGQDSVVFEFIDRTYVSMPDDHALRTTIASKLGMKPSAWDTFYNQNGSQFALDFGPNKKRRVAIRTDFCGGFEISIMDFTNYKGV